jgi:hypothetical protein
VGWVILAGYVLLLGFWVAAVWGALVLVRAVGWREARALPTSVCRELARFAERRPNHHHVDLELRDGRRVRGVRVDRSRYPSVIGGRTITQRYRVGDVVAVRRHEPALPRARLRRQIGIGSLVAIAGFWFGVLWHVIEDDTSVGDAVPTGLGMATLFVAVLGALVLLDRPRAQ